MNFLIRPVRFEDVEACANIFIDTFSRPPWNEHWEFDLVYSRLKQILDTPFSFGLIIEGTSPIGFALGFSEPWHQGNHFYLKEMCIHPDFQRQGLGTHLMNNLITSLREQNTQKIYLLTSRGDLSERFYAKLGFYTSPKMIMMAQHLK
jgi:ribosomal protein S18 acetylase RimI-like enzyme